MRFLTAIAIAQQQKARSFKLHAALHLARLCNSTSRSADAYALLASALKGFSPTPEFPEIAEAQTLVSALASNRTGRRRPGLGHRSGRNLAVQQAPAAPPIVLSLRGITAGARQSLHLGSEIEPEDLPAC
jgi:hypothetical protein